MPQKGFDFITITVSGNGRVKIPVAGNFLGCESSTGKFTVKTDFGSRLLMRTGASFGGTDDTRYGFLEVDDISGSSNTITLIYGFGRLFMSDNQTVTATVSGTVTTSNANITEASARLGDETSSKETDEDAAAANINSLIRGMLQFLKPSDTLSTTSDVAVTDNGKSSLSSSNVNRRKIQVKNLAANTNVFRIGDTNITATRGRELSPGESITLHTTAEVFAHQIGTGESLSLTEEIYSS